MGMNLRNSLNNGLNTGLRQSISGGVDGLGFFKTASLDLQFASNKTLNDRVSGSNLITFTRASTATYVDGNGVIQSATTNTPRFDHDPATGESLGLLIEEARTNLHTNSTVDAITQGITGLTQGSASITDPTGATSTVESWTVDTSTGEHDGYRFYNNTYVDFTWSLFVKANGITRIQVSASQRDNFNYIEVDLTDGSVINQTDSKATVTNFGGGWFRISVFRSSRAHGPGFWLLDSSGNRSFTGNGTDGVYVWGIQLEQQSGATFPTSYISTSGSTVTRAADVAEITGTNFSSWYNQSAGTWFAEASARGKLCNHSVSTSASSYQNSTQFFGSNIETDGFYRVRTDSSLMTSNFPGLTSIVPMQKYAGTYNSQSIQSAFQGTASTSVAVSGTFISGLAHMYIGRIHSGGPFRSHIKRLSYFSTRLDDATLESITS